MIAVDFAGMYGAPPRGVWSAPGRVNLMGEHTDYNGGAVLPIAIAARTRVAARATSGGVLRAASRQYPAEPVEVRFGDIAPGSPPGWGAYPAGVVWALRQRHPGPGGFDLLVDGGVPPGAGLASSAALTCAAALAVTDLAGLDLPPPELAEIARSAEHEIAGAPVGLMDQTAALNCRAGHALRFDTASGAIEHVPFDPAAAGLALAVIDTRVRHAHAAGGYRRRRQECAEAASRLGVALAAVAPGDLDDAAAVLADTVLWRRLRHVVTEQQRVGRAAAALGCGDWDRVGVLFDESHRSMRSDFAVTCAEVDLAATVARDGGARGARMTGGGFGGCVIALVDAASVDALRDAAVAAFASAGHTPPVVFTVSAAAGAHREPAGA